MDSKCVHYWICSKPTKNNTVVEVCKYCEERKEVKNVVSFDGFSGFSRSLVRLDDKKRREK